MPLWQRQKVQALLPHRHMGAHLLRKPLEPSARRVGSLTPALLKLAAREFCEDLPLAWEDFNQDTFPEPIAKDRNEEGIFNPYLIFDWNPFGRRRRSGKPRAGAVLGSYLEKHGSRLSELEILILLQAISRPVSFYEVVRCDPGRGVVLRDILIGEETHVEEHSGSKSMRPGDLVYGQIWILPEVNTLGRLGPRIIPPDRKVEIIALRTRLRRKIAKQNRELSAVDLIRYSDDIRTVYLDIRDAMFKPKKLVNTDGEPFVFHTLTFRIGSGRWPLTPSLRWPGAWTKRTFSKKWSETRTVRSKAWSSIGLATETGCTRTGKTPSSVI